MPQHQPILVTGIRLASSPFLIRPFDRSTDAIPDLTAILHRAYKPLSDQGMRYLASHQDDAITRNRVETGECYLARTTTSVHNIIGTTVIVPPGVGDPVCEYYYRPGDAHFQQFAVDPNLQNLGIGSALLNVVQSRAQTIGASELALDTSEHSRQLIAMYTKRNCELISYTDWPDTN